jgi:predicted HAD superfamily phosphohydrolase YqeG
MGLAIERVVERDDVLRRVRELSARTVIVDVEPLVAFWDTDDETLDRGVAGLVEQVAAEPGIRVLFFSTNSRRRLSVVPDAGAGLEVRYLADARKPLRTAPYRDLPGPGVVVGDQILTDGALAWRLGYTFLTTAPGSPEYRGDRG